MPSSGARKSNPTYTKTIIKHTQSNLPASTKIQKFIENKISNKEALTPGTLLTSFLVKDIHLSYHHDTDTGQDQHYIIRGVI